MKKKTTQSILVNNRKAFFSYEIVAKYTAGVMLHGPEVKSIRLGQVHLKESYCFFRDGALWIKGMHVGRYGPAAGYHEEPTRPRKLLLERRELKKLEKAKESEGRTIVPLKLFINEKSLIKIEIGLARGKKNYDKRIAIKERDLKRRLERNT